VKRDSGAGRMGAEVWSLKWMRVAEQTRVCAGDAQIPGAVCFGRVGPPAAAQVESAGVIGQEARGGSHGGGLDLGRVSMTCMTPTPQDGQRVRWSAETASTVLSGTSTATDAGGSFVTDEAASVARV